MIVYRSCIIMSNLSLEITFEGRFGEVPEKMDL